MKALTILFLSLVASMAFAQEREMSLAERDLHFEALAVSREKLICDFYVFPSNPATPRKDISVKDGQRMDVPSDQRDLRFLASWVGKSTHIEKTMDRTCFYGPWGDNSVHASCLTFGKDDQLQSVYFGIFSPADVNVGTLRNPNVKRGWTKVSADYCTPLKNLNLNTHEM